MAIKIAALPMPAVFDAEFGAVRRRSQVEAGLTRSRVQPTGDPHDQGALALGGLWRKLRNFNRDDLGTQVLIPLTSDGDPLCLDIWADRAPKASELVSALAVLAARAAQPTHRRLFHAALLRLES
jgi:hypothetical protein